MAKKNTTNEQQKVILEVYIMMTQGFRTQDIIHNISDKYNKTERTIRNYIKKAYKILKEENKKEIDQLRIEANARYDELYFKLRQDGKYTEAAKIQSLKDKINGLQTQNVIIKTEYDENLKNTLDQILKNG